MGRTPTVVSRNFGQIDSQKFRFFGLKSAVFDSRNATETKNELGIIKKIFRGLWDLFDAGRKNFDHPAPKRSILGVQKFLQNRIFGLNFSSFRLWEVSRAPKWFDRHQKLFTRALEPFGRGQKEFHPPHPEKVNFGVQKFLPKPSGPLFGQKKFLTIFLNLYRVVHRVVRRFLSGHLEPKMHNYAFKRSRVTFNRVWT